MKTAFVTGGSRGIGAAIALSLGRAGYAIALNYHQNHSAAHKVLETLQMEQIPCCLCPADVSDEAAITAAVCKAQAELGTIAVLVNNAGIAHQGLFQDTDSNTWHNLFATIVDGAYYATKAVLPAMIREKQGNIVNISSIWGLRGASCEVAYSSAKAALIGLTRSLAAEVAPSGVRVNAIAPGVIRTDMVTPLGEETITALANDTPLGRLGTPTDIANAVLFLISEKASFITGQVLTVDGGFVV